MVIDQRVLYGGDEFWHNCGVPESPETDDPESSTK